MYVEVEDFNKVIDTVKQQAKATESKVSLVRNLDELARLQHIRINSLEDQCDFLFKQMQKTHKRIFWYLIAVIIVNIGGLIAFHMVTP